MRPTLVPLALLLVAVGVARCGGSDGDGASSTTLEGVPWLLVSGVEVAGWEGSRPSAVFEGGTVSGSTGCNRFTAPYSVDGDTLELGAVASTRMACPPSLDAVERAYLAALEQVARWRTEDDELVLLDDGDAELLRFDVGTPAGSWQATGILRGDAFVSLIAGTEITASFAADGELTGSGGCNSYRATFTGERGRIEISAPVATRKACASPEGVMDQEQAYLGALLSAAHYSVDGRSLELQDADGKRLVSYRPADRS